MDPKDNPKEHERMTENTDSTPESPATMKEQLDTVLPGSNPLQGIKAVHEGGTSYSVLSVRNGGPSYHYVELGSDPECTCGDYRFNRDEAKREPCAHIVAAVLAPYMDADQLAVRELVSVTGRAAEASRQARDTAERLDDALVSMREATSESDGQGGSVNSGSSQSAQQATGGPQDMPHTTDPAEAAGKLQEAYDDVVEDMQVQASNGYVWVQTGQDTPDTLPGPGNVDVFDAFLKNADAVEFVHDNHDLVDKKPGEWWKNAIEPSAVDEYIDEVLV